MVGGSELVTDLPFWGQAGLVLGAAFLLAAAVRLTGALLARQTREKSRVGLLLVEGNRPLYLSILIFGGLAAFHVAFSRYHFYAEATATTLLVVVWAQALVRIGTGLIQGGPDRPATQEFAPILRNLLVFFVAVAGVLLLLSVWQVNITPLLASAGVIGIVVGIAAQDTIGNFFGGLSLYLDKTYRLGDVIELESGERGTVVDMSIRSTTVLTRDNIAITVPNGKMNSTQVINESAPVRRRRIRLDVGVAYGSDLETVEEILYSIAAEADIVIDTPPTRIRFRRFADSAIVAQMQCYIEHPALRGRAYHLLIKDIDERFRENDIKIPFPQRELTFFEAGNEVRIDDIGERSGTAHTMDEVVD